MSVSEYIEEVISREGGSRYTNRAADLGGPTKYGITAKTLGRCWNLGRPATEDEVKSLTLEQATQIYLVHYWQAFHLDLIKNQVVAEFMFDWYVNSNEDNATKELQAWCEAYQDGDIGPNTAAKIEAKLARDGWVSFNQLVDRRVYYVLRLCQRVPSQVANVVGWYKRINSFRRYESFPL